MPHVPERRRHRTDEELRTQREELMRRWETQGASIRNVTRISTRVVDTAASARTRTLIRVPNVERFADVSASDMAIRAYELYQLRGGEHGHDLDDWLQAERELRRRMQPNAA